jgi:hypothetical protein
MMSSYKAELGYLVTRSQIATTIEETKEESAPPDSGRKKTKTPEHLSTLDNPKAKVVDPENTTL